jgi:hypothetical protein
LWSGRPFIMGNKQDKLSLLLSTHIYDQWQYLSYFESLLQNLLCTTHCMLLIMMLFSFSFNEVIFV